MKGYEINNQIRQIEYQTQYMEQQISQIEKNIQQLAVLTTICITYLDELESSKRRRKSKMERLYLMERQPILISEYMVFSRQVLDGIHYRCAYESINSTVDNIEREIIHQEQLMHEYQQGINEAKYKIRNIWQEQMREQNRGD